MSDCCEVHEPAAAGGDRCPRCGVKGRLVSRKTMQCLLKPEALARLADEAYRFDRTSECEVVYFSNEARSTFHKDDLTVRVGLKERSSPILLCYCFGHTVETVREEIVVTGRSSVAKTIAAEIQAGNCSCEVKNPSGRCCLGDVNRAIAQIQRDLEEAAVSGS